MTPFSGTGQIDDISRIDFDLLRHEFAKAKNKNLVLKDLDELIAQRIGQMLSMTPGRINYYDRYQEIITSYTAEQDRATIEKTFMDLMDLASSLDEEQQRYVREGFSSDEELSLYDLLFQDNLIRDILWAELPESYEEIRVSEYRRRIYEYVYTTYR